MKKLMILAPLFMTACINMSSSAAPAKWTQSDRERWALALVDIKKQINDCYFHLRDENYDQFNADCDAMALGARLNDIINEYETQKGLFPDLSDEVFITKEYGFDMEVARSIAADHSAIDHMKGFIASFAIADVIINH